MAVPFPPKQPRPSNLQDKLNDFRTIIEEVTHPHSYGSLFADIEGVIADHAVDIKVGNIDVVDMAMFHKTIDTTKDSFKQQSEHVQRMRKNLLDFIRYAIKHAKKVSK